MKRKVGTTNPSGPDAEAAVPNGAWVGNTPAPKVKTSCGACILGIFLSPVWLVFATLHALSVTVVILGAFLASIGMVFSYPVIDLLWGCPRLELKGTVVLITGGSSGIGADTARLLASKGAKVVVWARREKELVALCEDLNRRYGSGSAFHCCCDVSTREGVNTAAERTRQMIAPLTVTVVVGNAGVMHTGPIESQDPDVIRRQFDVNVLANYWLVQAFLPDMKAQKRGYFLFVSSLASFVQLPGVCSYGATKHALTGFSQSLRAELQAITNGAVLCGDYRPGIVQTDMTTGIRFQNCLIRLAMPQLKSEGCARSMVRMIQRRSARYMEPWRSMHLMKLVFDQAWFPRSTLDFLDKYIAHTGSQFGHGAGGYSTEQQLMSVQEAVPTK